MRWVSLSAALTKVALLGLLSCQSDQSVEPNSVDLDCLVKASVNNGQVITGSYIVTYKPETISSANARVGAAVEQFLSRHHVANVQATILASGPKTTFLAEMTEAQSKELAQDAAVELVEPDRIMSICSCVDVAATSTLTWNVKQTGYGRGDLQTDKTVWIIDSGIDLDHPDLNVDTDRSVSFVSGKTADDENGHGTHVAGIIGAKNNTMGTTGVASGARLVALKVLNQLGEGRLSSIIQAINHVARNGKSGDVVNLSLGGEGTSTTLDQAIRQAANQGILFAIAAGNESANSDESSPARVNHANVFTVSAMDQNNRFASFSNFGSSIDFCAYGVRIRSTYKNGTYATLSGTSMAAPHVAGLLLIRGSNVPTRGYVDGDPDGQPDPIARE